MTEAPYPVVEWTPEKLKRFKKAWKKSGANGRDVFTFEGHEYVADYAKYLVEYLESHWGKQ